MAPTLHLINIKNSFATNIKLENILKNKKQTNNKKVNIKSISTSESDRKLVQKFAAEVKKISISNSSIKNSTNIENQEIFEKYKQEFYQTKKIAHELTIALKSLKEKINN